MNFSNLLSAVALTVMLFGFTWCDDSPGDKATAPGAQQKRENPQERLEAEFNMIKDPVTGKIPDGIRAVEIDAAFATPSFSLSKSGSDKALPDITIASRGPNNYGGRTRALGFDIRNSDIVIAGGISGGIFRSTNRGEDWTRVTPAGEIHNVSTVVQDNHCSQQDVWYAGTGESLGNSTSITGGFYYGYGILKSYDNGMSWEPLPSTRTSTNLENFDSDFDFVNKIIVHPVSGDVMVAAGESIQRSEDFGESWNTVLGTVRFGEPSDIIFNSADSIYYAAIYGGAPAGGVYTSTDGISWAQVRSKNDLDSTGVGRIVLSNLGDSAGVAVFYELTAPVACSNGDTSKAGLQTLKNGTWTNHTDKVGNCNTGGAPTKQLELQGGYNMCMVSKPDDENLIYFGGVEIYRYNLSTERYDFIGGSQQAANLVNLHVDSHILLFDPNNDEVMWSGNDGGLRNANVNGRIRTMDGDDNGYSWASKNHNYITYQYYGADINPQTGSQFVAGAAQDNAFTVQPTTAEALEVGPTADGTSVAIISGTSFSEYSVLASWQYGGLVRIDNGVETDIKPTGMAQDFISRIFLDADNTQILYYPTTDGDLLRTTNAGGLSDGTITGNASTGWEELTGVTSSSPISTFETTRNPFGAVNGSYNASDGNRKLYFGSEGGQVYRLNDPAYGSAGTVPVNITPNGASGFVSDIAINPENDKEIVVTYSNYGVSSIWHTTDASVANPTWTQIEGAAGTAVALASVRSALIVKAGTQLIYIVGTSTGLYATDTLAGMNTVWERVGNMDDIGLAVCSFMRLRPSDNHAVLGTHGNGLFLLEFPQSALPVRLTSFTGSPTNKGNTLNWATAEEVDNAGFEVERSEDGEHFKRIAFVPSASSPTRGLTAYEYFDTPLINDLTYYRLKQIDFDDSFDYSEVISVRNVSDLTTTFNVYPNPVVSNLTVTKGEGEAIIFNAAGQQVLQTMIMSPLQEIDVSALPAGAYLILIRKQSGEITSRKFIR